MSEKWPKTYRPLTEEEKWIKDDFMHYWHEVLPKRYGIVEIFNHNYPVKRFKKVYDTKKHWMTMEIGGDLGPISLLKKSLRTRNIVCWNFGKIC